jgi:biotin synthase
MNATAIRHDWNVDEVLELLELPLLELLDRARRVHRAHHDPTRVQLATLANIKPGGCSEDCAYCPQAARYHTDVKAQPMLKVEDVVEQAKAARDAGASRFCMGAAWRRVRDGEPFDRVVDMVREVNALGVEVCVTLGMLDPHQIERLRDAGLSAYNHNLDTSREHYAEIITTRTYDDRLDTLKHVRDAGVSVCCGGIVGLGETLRDRAGLLATLANLDPHPESVPINKLVRAKGTPLEDAEEIDALDFVRTVAVARILMPASLVRLAAGRLSLSKEARVLAFQAGANSIFYGERLLTTPNPDVDEDRALLAELGLTPMEPRLRAPIAADASTGTAADA